MSVTEYGPEETWPSHRKPYWKVALKQARPAGWTLRYLGSPHWFGVVVCPDGEHTFGVDSTARGAETTAAEVPKLLRSCPLSAARSGASKVAQRTADVRRLLGRAEELVDLAADHLGRAESRQSALAEIDRLELLLETAQATVDEGLVIAQDEALNRAADLEDAPGPEVVAAALDDAEQTTEAAAGIAVRIRRSTVAKPLLDRAARIQQRIARLRARLEHLQGVGTHQQLA